METAIVCKMRT